MGEKINVMIIIREMFPYAGAFGNGQRMHYLANYLCDRGCSVTMLSEKRGKKNRSLQNIEKKYDMMWVPRSENPESDILNTDTMKKISKYIFNEIYEGYAFCHYLWSLAARKAVDEIIIKKAIDVVIISAPCFSTFSLINPIKNKFKKVKVILDYRDPWYLFNLQRGMAKLLEKKYIRRSDKVVLACDRLRDDMIKVFPEKNSKYDVVYNGFCEGIWKDINLQREPGKRMVVAYIGNIGINDSSNNLRNPNRLINVFNRVCQDKNMELRFIGIRERTSKMGKIEKESRYKIKFLPPVTAYESLEKMAEGDVLVVINDIGNQADKYAYSGKVFDYLRSGRLIWGIGTTESVLKSFIRKNEVGVFCRNEEKEIEKVLLCLYRKWEKEGCIKRKNGNMFWKFYSREYQNEHYYQIIKEII